MNDVLGIKNEQYRFNFFQWGTIILFCLASVIIGIWAYPNLFPQRPLTILDSILLTPVIYQGQDLEFYVKQDPGNNRRDCMSVVTREFQKKTIYDGREMWKKARSVSVGPPIVIDGEKEYVSVIDVPEGLEPGEYRFLGETMMQCPLGSAKKFRMISQRFILLARNAEPGPL